MNADRPLYFKGIQKTTLLDYPGEVACTLFTGGCNFRCGYCYNGSLVLNEDTGVKISHDEALEFLKERKGFLDGVCITGGEPLLEPELEKFIKEAKALGYKVKLDTNGSFPDKLKSLLDQKLLDYVALDLKAPKHKYAQVTKVAESHHNVEKSMKLLLSSGVECEFRTTVFSHLNETDIVEIAQWAGEKGNYFLQRGKMDLPQLESQFAKDHTEVTHEFLTQMADTIRPRLNKVGVR